MSGWTPKWLEFEADLVEEHVPEGFLDFLATFAAGEGFVVREETHAAPPTESAYRSASVVLRDVVIEIPRALRRRHPMWRVVRVRQDGAALRLRGRIPNTSAVILSTAMWPMWVLANRGRNSHYEVPLLVLISALGLATYALSLRRGRLDGKASAVAFLEQALRAQRESEAPTPEPVAREPAHPAIPSEPRIRVADPALAAAVRAGHVDKADRDLEAPEDLVAELERRGGGET